MRSGGALDRHDDPYLAPRAPLEQGAPQLELQLSRRLGHLRAQVTLMEGLGLLAGACCALLWLGTVGALVAGHMKGAPWPGIAIFLGLMGFFACLQAMGLRWQGERLRAGRAGAALWLGLPAVLLLPPLSLGSLGLLPGLLHLLWTLSGAEGRALRAHLARKPAHRHLPWEVQLPVVGWLVLGPSLILCLSGGVVTLATLLLFGAMAGPGPGP
jgi:asparagine N-glycosylation enzyme membrane subunit Stt3